MRLLLLLMFTATIFFSQAQQTNALVNGEPDPSILITCLPMVLIICASIAAGVYFLSINNKRRDRNEKDNSGKNI